MYDDTGIYGLEQGCPVHGDESLRECSACGAEFCRACITTPTCPDCSAQSTDDEEEQADFEDVRNLDELIGDDEEVEKILLESETEAPPADLEED